MLTAQRTGNVHFEQTVPRRNGFRLPAPKPGPLCATTGFPCCVGGIVRRRGAFAVRAQETTDTESVRKEAALSDQALVESSVEGNILSTTLESISSAGERSAPTRLWSNLNPQTLKHEPGSVAGAAALVAGTTVGAGILALPAVTAESGFAASSTVLGGVCMYSIITGLLIAEVNINTMCELGSGGVSLVSMAERTMGKAGMRIASATYIFLHYTLLVAYTSKGGSVVSDFLHVPQIAGALAFNLALGGLCYGASSKTLDKANSLLVGLVVTSFLGLLVTAATIVEPSNLLKANWSAVPETLPVVSLAFVYQNVVPVIASNLEGDIRKVRHAIVLGSMIPFCMFVAWDAAILGSAGTLAPGGADQVVDPLLAIKQTSPIAGPLVEAFSFLAIGTSFIGFVLGLSDFLADALKLPAGERKALPYALTLVPPFLLALTLKDVFFQALDVAGTYGVLVLFGVIPAIMAWNERYNGVTLSSRQVVPGGKAGLLLIGGSASFVILKELLESLQFN